MSGTLTFRVNTSRKAIMSVSSSRSGLARQTSSTCAPPRTWRRPTSAAWSRSPPTTSSLNLRLPMTFVRSPTTTGRRSSSMGSTSIPETMVRRTGAALRGRWRRASSARSRMCSAVVPQQPPMMFTQPSAQKRSTLVTSDSGVSLYRPSSSGRPAVGKQEARAVGRLEARARRAREPRGGGVDLAHLVLKAVLAEHDARAAEGIGLDDVRAGGEVALVHVADHVGAGQDQVLVAALVLGATEVPGGEVATLDVRPRRAVEDDDALGEKGAQAVAAGGGAHEAAMITGRSRGGNLRS